ncbi:MAG TPA: NAD(P)H-hydrate dehydratase [Epsilonproteobacteria bacterium]|nr:NAD(P)H-hydrate dehydratase [Campylobacterota bacterium]
MQRVFDNCYAMDRRCYAEYGLTEDILMEHAAEGMAVYIREYFSEGSTLLIVAGMGNNGADGIVLARLLHARYDVRLVLPFGVKSAMARLQLERAKKIGVVPADRIDTGAKSVDLLVDALFGAGLNRELDQESQAIVAQMNQIEAFKIACHMSTGISESGEIVPVAFRGDLTITMEALKESLYLDEAKAYTGVITCVELVVDRSLYVMQSDTFVLEQEDMHLPTRRSKGTHKGSFGHAVLFCGEKEGASVIAGSAALRFGAGLTTLVVREHVLVPPFLMTATSVPETATALAIGMGMGDFFGREFIRNSILQSSVPLLLDADSFYSRELLSVLEQPDRPLVLTPHPKEFASLWEITMGEALSVTEIQKHRFALVRKFSERYPQAVLLLKGANMLIAHQKKVWINPLGSSRLSKGGSGDVLSGLIVGLLAQGYRAKEAAITASLALAEATRQYEGSSYSMLPTDLVEAVGRLELSEKES